MMLLSLSLLSLAGCTDEETSGSKTAATGDEPGVESATAIQFSDRTAQSGITAAYDNGESAELFTMLESVGGGLAVLDYDLDGRQDLLVPGGGRFPAEQTISGRKPGLYRNRGGWQFQEATGPAGFLEPAEPYYSHGAIVSDYDSDGWPDVLITGYGGLLLYHNQGDGTFQEVAAAAGLQDRSWSTSAAWGDLNQDGHPDLYIAHYVNWSFENDPVCWSAVAGVRDICPPRRFDGLDDVVFLNRGNGTFHDATEELGLSPGGKGLGVLIADLDRDFDLDIYVANDTDPNFLYFNSGGGRLEESAFLSGAAVGATGSPEGSMGIDLADVNRDGTFDLWVSNFEGESFGLYGNDDGGRFRHLSGELGVDAAPGLYVGWGTAFVDFDHDGNEDVFSTTGHVILHPQNSTVEQRPVLFVNHNGKKLQLAELSDSYCAATHNGRGLAAGDFDGDGDVDLALSHLNAPVALLENRSRQTPVWLAFRLIGTQSARIPIGAVVEVHQQQRTQLRQQKGGGSYASSSDLRLFFGFPKETPPEDVVIYWPSGRIQHLKDVGLNQVVTVIEPRGD